MYETILSYAIVNKSKRKRYLDKWDVRWCVWPFGSVWYTELSFSQRVWRWFPRWCRDQIWSPELCVSSSGVHEMSSAVSVTRLTLTNSSCWYLYRARRSALITAARVSINIIIQKTDVHISVCVFMNSRISRKHGDWDSDTIIVEVKISH